MHIDVNALITQYGYWALLIGCLAEGETFTLLGGIAAHQGLLHYQWVVLIAALGGIIGDQLLFWIGRRYGHPLQQRFKKQQARFDTINQLIRRYPSLIVIGVRFMYGFRLIGPVMIGASRLPPLKFLLLNIIGAFLWATLFVSLGYLGGEVIAPWLHKIDQHLKHLVWLGIAVAFVVALRLLVRRYKKNR
ncbi:hypothetical protein CIG19_17350 [Enterobacterales bacterium CwR94]|nr:hypothetical protein CIG19_17350 [Enterobacterales bacterium CwR94]